MHKKKKYALILIFLSAAKLFSMDLTIIGGTGNFSFNNSSETPIGDGTFGGNFFPISLVKVEDQLTDTFGYTATAERDYLLRNVLMCEMTINSGFINLSVGPLFSLFNSKSTYIRPGVTTSIGLEFPGIFYVSFRGGATFGSIPENDYGLETSCIAVGIWVPNVLNTLSLTTKKYSEFDTVFTQDELYRVCYRADIFAKNAPYTVSVEMGYQSLKREYFLTDEDMIRQIFLGFETNITVKPRLVFIFGAETPLFVWGKYPLIREKGKWYLRAYTGITWTKEAKS